MLGHPLVQLLAVTATYYAWDVQMYAASFFVIPALRWLLNQQRNLSLQTANRIRLDRLRELREPDPALQQKLLSAEKQAQRTVIRCRTGPIDQTIPLASSLPDDPNQHP